MFTYETVLQESEKYFGNELSAKVFVDKYALKDNDDNYLEKTPNDMHHRLAKEFARIQAIKYKDSLTEDEIFDCFKGFKRIIPQGSPMYGIGNPYKTVSLSNCFVVESPLDSYGGICSTDQNIVQISKRRGGIGYDISNLRPATFNVNNAAGTTTGATSFMHRFSHTGREVGQEGRRAAQMITISVHHPDILRFATIKNDDVSVTGANISIRLSDEFLNAVKDDKEYQIRWPVDVDNPEFSKMISAKDVWDTIIHSAWLRAEPGLLFWDHIIRESPADCYYAFGFNSISTNPCGEIILCSDDSCRLLALMLFYYVNNPYTYKAEFDFERFYKDAQIAQRLMDDIVDMEAECIDKIIAKIKNDPEPNYIKQPEIDLWTKIKDKCQQGRRTGTGITGLGDTLAALGIKYGSKKSIEVTDKIYKTLKLGCYRASVDMAKELGPFPLWDKKLEKKNPFLLRIKDEDPQLYADMQKYGRRNIAILTTAPTGSLSIMAGMNIGDKTLHNCSSGIEPIYAIETKRRKKGNPSDKNFRVDYVDDLGDSWMEFNVNHAGQDLWISQNEGKDLDKSPYVGAVANEINWQNRVKLQAAAQRHVDHSISSTINLPNNVEEKEVSKIYQMAWESGCKGITVYRDGCRSGVILTKQETIKQSEAPIRPKELNCDVYHLTVKGKPYFVLVGLLDGQPYEVFAGRNGVIDGRVKKGKIVKVLRPKHYRAILEDETVLSPLTIACDDDEEALSRMTSTALRHGAKILFIVEQLEKVQGGMSTFAKAMSRALKKYIPDGTKISSSCPECNTNSLVRQEGCIICVSCGFSKCM